MAIPCSLGSVLQRTGFGANCVWQSQNKNKVLVKMLAEAAKSVQYNFRNPI